MKDIVSITNSGNLLRHCELGFYFQSQKGEFLREASQEEAEFLTLNCLQATIEFLPEHPTEFPVWKFITSIRVMADYSNYQPETSNNGGNYSFSVHHDWFCAKYPDGSWKFAYITRHSTSSEFDFDELNGTFHQGRTFVTLLNAPNASDYKSQTYSGENEFEVLEGIATMSDFDQLFNWEILVTVDSEETIQAPAISYSDKKEIIEKLKEIGVEKSPKPKNHRRTRAGGGGTRK